MIKSAGQYYQPQTSATDGLLSGYQRHWMRISILRGVTLPIQVHQLKDHDETLSALSFSLPLSVTF